MYYFVFQPLLLLLIKIDLCNSIMYVHFDRAWRPKIKQIIVAILFFSQIFKIYHSVRL